MISNNGKRIVRLQDIAEIQVKEAVEYIKVNANGKEGLLIAVIKQPNSNLIDVSNTNERKNCTSLRKYPSKRCNHETLLYPG